MLLAIIVILFLVYLTGFAFGYACRDHIGDKFSEVEHLRNENKFLKDLLGIAKEADTNAESQGI